MTELAENINYDSNHLDRIKVKLDKADLVRTLSILLVCEPELIATIDAHLDDIKREYNFYKEEYGL